MTTHISKPKAYYKPKKQPPLKVEPVKPNLETDIVEIVDFYLHNYNCKTKEIYGTLHIYIIPFKMDIRGVNVYKTKKGFFFQLPSYRNFDHEEKKWVKYPIVCFTDRAIQKKIILELQKNGRKYIESCIEEKKAQYNDTISNENQKSQDDIRKQQSGALDTEKQEA